MIKQITPHDCWPTCLAMALGITHAKMRATIGKTLWQEVKKNGSQYDVKKKMLAKFNLHQNHDYWVLFPSSNHVASYFLRNILAGRRAIISVMSKNVRDGHHAIYWDGSTLFDPSPRNVYTWEEVEAHGVLIFNERT